MEKLKNKVLLIDDEPQIRRLLRIALEANDFHVDEASTAQEGLLMASMKQPDIILLDLGLPDKDGLDVIARLRAWSNIPILVLTVQDDDETKITALDSGADDYITKPFNTGELLARIRVSLRRNFKPDETPVFRTGMLEVDQLNRMVFVNGGEVKLTVTEYSILALLVRHAGRVLTHNQIMREVWGIHYADNYQTLRVHIGQLRRKIEDEPSVPKLLLTESGVGYRLKIVSL
jgi:two-component system, OmpR family, KDP operon response regulator KdpE